MGHRMLPTEFPRATLVVMATKFGT